MSTSFGSTEIRTPCQTISQGREPKIPHEINNGREWDPKKHSLPQRGHDENEGNQVKEARVNNKWDTEASAGRPKTADHLTHAVDEGNATDQVNDGFHKVVRKSTKRQAERDRGRAAKLSSTTTHKHHPLPTYAHALQTSNTREPVTVNPVASKSNNAKIAPGLNAKAQSSGDLKPHPAANWHSRELGSKLSGNAKTRPSAEKKASSPSATIESRPSINIHGQRLLDTSAPASQARANTAGTTYKKISLDNDVLPTKPASGSSKLPAAAYKPATRASRPARGIFNFERDNTAKKAFRQRKEPCGIFELHKDIVEIEPDVSRLQKIFRKIEVQFETYIRPPITGNDRELLIWGNDRQTSKTKTELGLWIRQIEDPQLGNSGSKDKFSSVYSVIGDKYKAIKRETAAKAKLAYFQQNPDPTERFEYGGLYRWPNDEVNPQELFGSNLEALDLVRYMNRCHIVFDERLRMIRLYTNKDGALRNVLKIIEGSLKEFYARESLERQTGTVVLVDISQCNSASRVGLEQHNFDPDNPEKSGTVFAPVLRQSGPNEDLDYQIKASRAAFSNTVIMQRALNFAIPHLRLFRGRVSMKVEIGTFALETFKWPPEKPTTIDLDLFLKNMTEESIKGRIIRNVCSQTRALDILNTIKDSSDLFEPLYGLSGSLYDVAPTYKARFTIARYQKPTVVLELEWTSGTYEKDVFTKTKTSWSSSERGTYPPLSLYNLRLGSSLSSLLQISRSNLFDRSRISENMDEFEESVKLNSQVPKAGAENDGRKLVIWPTDKPGCLKPSQFEQTISYQYRVKNMPEMIFELARQDFFDSRNSAPDLSSHHTNWTASLWSSEWEMKFSQNTSLGLGERVKWIPSISTFFLSDNQARANKSDPNIEPGLLRLMQNLKPILERLDDKGKDEGKDKERDKGKGRA